MSHTATPWRAHFVHTERRLSPTVWSDGKQIAVVGPSSASAEECDSNAALISAAPEMIDALEHLMSYDFGDSEGAIKARYAINKARGRI